jgi:hypothetical protein
MTMIAGLFPVFIFLVTLGSYETTLLHDIDRSVRSLQGEVREETGAVAKSLSEDGFVRRPWTWPSTWRFSSARTGK